MDDLLSKLLIKISKLDRKQIMAKVMNDAFEEFAIDLNRIDQLYDQGINSQDKEIQPPYSAVTKIIKERKNQPTNRVTLKDTGEFYNTFDIKIFTNMDFEITADEAGKDLFERYGRDILGWTHENTDKIVKYIQDGFIQEVIRQIN